MLPKKVKEKASWQVSGIEGDDLIVPSFELGCTGGLKAAWNEPWQGMNQSLHHSYMLNRRTNRILKPWLLASLEEQTVWIQNLLGKGASKSIL